MIGARDRRLALIEEESWGQVPTSGAWHGLPVQSESLTEVIRRERSGALLGSRQAGDVVTLEAGARGRLVSAFRPGMVDPLLKGACGGEWQGGPELGADEISSVGTGGTIALVGGGGAFAAGDLVQLSGFVGSGNAGLFVVSAATGASLIVQPVDGGDGTSDEVAILPQAWIVRVGVRAVAGSLSATIDGLQSGAGGPDFVALGLEAGDWIQIGGALAVSRFEAVSTGGLVRVAEVSATALTLDALPVGWAVDAGTGKEIELYLGSSLNAGGDLPSFSLEKALGETLFCFSGLKVDQLELVLSATEEVAVTAELEGGAVTVSDGSAVPTGEGAVSPALSAGQDVGRLLIDGAEPAAPNFIRRIDVRLQNGLAATRSLGELAPVGLTEGLAEISGQMVAWFGDRALYDRFKAGSALSLVVSLNGGGKGYVLELPVVVFDAASVVVDGPEEDVLAEFSFLAMPGTNGDAAMTVTRFEVMP